MGLRVLVVVAEHFLVELVAVQLLVLLLLVAQVMPAEVMVDGGEWRLSRRRQTIDDQLSCEEG